MSRLTTVRDNSWEFVALHSDVNVHGTIGLLLLMECGITTRLLTEQ